MNILYIIGYFLICYLLGSIPSALIIGKTFKNIDIREHGSGNLGATNAMRILGTKLGIIVALMDVFKGGVTILLAKHLFITDIDPIIFGVFAVIGHVFPIFANFRGGKAVATSGGILLFYSSPIFVLGILAFAIMLITTRFVSLSSSVVALFILLSSIINSTLVYHNLGEGLQSIIDIIFLGERFNVYFVGTVWVLFLLVVIRHIPNYKRLLNRTERKVGKSS